MSQSKKAPTKREQRRMRTQQVVFAIVAGIIILSWIIGMLATY